MGGVADSALARPVAGPGANRWDPWGAAARTSALSYGYRLVTHGAYLPRSEVVVLALGTRQVTSASTWRQILRFVNTTLEAHHPRGEVERATPAGPVEVGGRGGLARVDDATVRLWIVALKTHFPRGEV